MKNMTAMVAIMAVFTLAVCFIFLGSISTELMARLGLDANQFGTLVTVFSFTCMIVQLLVGPLVDKLGHKPLAVAGLLIASASIFLFGFAGTYAIAVVATILLGVGAICCNTVGNTLLPVALFDRKDPARASNFGCGFVGLGFVLVPLLIATFMGNLGLSYTVSVIGTRIIAVASLVAIVALLVMTRAQSPGLAILAVLVIGLAYAPMFPTIVGVTFSKFDASVYGSVFGIIFSIGLVGSMVLPKVIGHLSKDKPIQQSLPIAAAIAGLLLLLAVAMEVSRRPKQAR